MSTLSQPLADHLACIEAYAHCARKAVNCASLDVARMHLDTIIASLQEAQASLAHEREIAESRAAVSSEEPRK